MGHCLNKYINKRPNNYLYIEINNKYYPGKIGIFDRAICKKFEHRCQMEVHYVNFNVPWKIAQKVTTVNIINIITKSKQVFNVSKESANSKPFNGLTICVPILYWYNNWLQMFLFLENWYREGNAKIILYYKSLSPEVYNLLRYYVKIKLVILYPVSNYPIKESMNPANLTHGMGSKIFLNTCMYKMNSKYISVMDIDEYFYIYSKNKKKQKILNFIKSAISRQPNKNFFNFESFHISYKNTIIDPSFNFHKKAYLSIDKKNVLGKSVMLTNKISHFGFHIPQFEKLSDGYRFSSNQAILLHARSNYILKKTKKLPEIEIINENERKNLNRRYILVEKQINMSLPFVYGPAMEKHLESCISMKARLKARVCFVIYDKCKNIMDKISKWIYSEDDLINYKNFTVFN
ncbi:Domain of unknown function DUF23 domain-containing protein [Strongyloides ratti]|uniref:Glycosyltransferase family 92 protein n=1 Tax=Strongyloides ratti TaxID=34506 RepID=A0A090N052_STRRB|nr:Domain of unknown function DUF23 domain-containing protein [Strongyloides ratti]CEF70080.1 Domain of unknown function DUF23 domain-containing protein [Strongyloides ratti]